MYVRAQFSQLWSCIPIPQHNLPRICKSPPHTRQSRRPLLPPTTLDKRNQADRVLCELYDKYISGLFGSGKRKNKKVILMPNLLLAFIFLCINRALLVSLNHLIILRTVVSTILTISRRIINLINEEPFNRNSIY